MAFDLGALRINIFGKDRFTPEFKKTIDKTEKMGKKLSKIGRRASLGVSVPLLAAGGVMFKVAADFEAGMQSVRSVINQVTDEDMDRLSDKAIELGQTTRFTAIEAAAGMEELGRAGMSTAFILKGTEASLALAAATKMELADSAMITADVMNAFQEPLDNVNSVVGLLAGSTSLASITLEDMKESMKHGATSAKTFGMSIKETATAIGFMGSVGIKGSTAGTAIKQMTTRLAAAAGGKLPAAVKAMNTIGITAVDKKTGKMRKFIDVMTDIATATKNMSDPKRIGIIKDIFGMIPISSANAMIADLGRVVGPDGVDPSKFRELTKAMEGVNNAAFDMAKIRNTGATPALLRLKAAYETLSIALMERTGFLAGATDLIDKLAKIVGHLSKAHPAVLKMGLALMGVGIVLPPLIIGMGMLVTAVASLLAMSAPMAIFFGGLTAAALAVVPAIMVAHRALNNIMDDPLRKQAFADNPFETLKSEALRAMDELLEIISKKTEEIVPRIQAGLRKSFAGTGLLKFSDGFEGTGIAPAARGGRLGEFIKDNVFMGPNRSAIDELNMTPEQRAERARANDPANFVSRIINKNETVAGDKTVKLVVKKFDEGWGVEASNNFGADIQMDNGNPLANWGM